MILSHYELDNTFDLQPNKVNVLVVENQNLFWQYWRELHQQIEGNDGRFVLSANGEDMPFSRHALIVADYVSLSVNNKKILNKLYSTLDYVIHNNCLAEYQKLLEAWSNLYLRINIESPVPIVHDEITTSVLLKACSATIEQQDTLLDKLVQYIRVNATLLQTTCFFFVNLHTVLNQEQLQAFYHEVALQEVNIFLLESKVYDKQPQETVTVIDDDLCQIVV